MHRPLVDHENLDGAVYRKEVRALSQTLMLRYDKVLFILDPTDLSRSLAGKKVVVCDYPDGCLSISRGRLAMRCQIFGTLRSVHRSVVVENERLDGVLSVILESRSVGASAQKKVRNVSG